MNTVAITGTIANELMLRETADGIKYLPFTVKVRKDYVKKGETRGADYPDFIAWRYNAEHIATYFKKGDSIALVAAVRTTTRELGEGETARRVKTTEFEVTSVSFISPFMGPQNNTTADTAGEKTDAAAE